MSPRVDQTLERAKGFMNGFTSGQRTVVVVAGLALVLGAVALTRWMAQPDWTPLYGNLSGTDANAIVDQLNSDGVKYQLADGGATVLVPRAQVYDERIALAGKGLPAANTDTGYSILDKQGITATDFQQNIAYQRALEGELDKTLGAMTGVQTAVVHLAIPKQDVFATQDQKTTASVLIAAQPGKVLGTDQVRAITHLVAGAIPNLDPGDVTVSDATGKLLSSPDTTGAGAGSASVADEQTAQYENRLGTAVQSMLDAVLGTGNSVVRVNAQLDFSRQDTTTQAYATNTGIPPLSQASVSESYNGNGAAAGGALGVTQPSLAPVAGQTGGAYARQQNTVNNAVGSVVTKSVSAPGAVQRLTVSVVLNSKKAGVIQSSQIQALVGNAVGLNAKRGDSVQVDSLPFDSTAATQAAKDLATANREAKTASYLELGKKAGIGLLVLIVLFVLLRRSRGGDERPQITGTASDLPQEGVLIHPTGALGDGQLAALPSGLALEAGRDSMRAEVAELVESQPEDVAAMLQGWLAEQKG